MVEQPHQFEMVHGETASDALGQIGGEFVEELLAVTRAVFARLLVFDDVPSDCQ